MVNPAATLPVPSPIREIRAFDTTALSLEISVNNELPEIHTGQQSSDFWRVSVDVPVLQKNTIKFVWIENYEQERLALAQQLTTVQTRTEAGAEDRFPSYTSTGLMLMLMPPGLANKQTIATVFQQRQSGNTLHVLALPLRSLPVTR